MLSIKNFMKHPLTTLAGAVTGLLQAGITSAVVQYSQTPGQVFDWKPYAAAAAVGMATFILGGLLPDRNSNPAAEIAAGAILMEGVSLTPAPPSPIPLNPVILEAVEKIMITGVLEKLGVEFPKQE